MKPLGYVLALLVALLNVLLHICAVTTTGSLTDRLASRWFVLAFSLGALSLCSIFAFYANGGPNLARGLLLMGSASIIGGTLFGVTFRSQRLEPVEWLLFALIAAFYFSRLILLLPKHPNE